MTPKENMKQLFIDCAVRIVARYGLDKTTTRLIADEAGLNEMYLYRCFKNKENLLSCAFYLEDTRFLEVIQKVMPTMQLASLSCEKRCFLLWKACWEFVLEKPDDCRFYIRYYYSANCKAYAYAEHLKRYRPLMDAARVAFKPDTNVDMLLHQIFDTLLSFAERVQTGELAHDEKTTALTFRQIFSFVVIHIRPELLHETREMAVL